MGKEEEEYSLSLMEKIAQSPGYKDACKRVESWKKKLMDGGRASALLVLKEKAFFFSRMREENPGMYRVFRVALLL